MHRIDAAYYYTCRTSHAPWSACLSVRVLSTPVSPAKPGEPIEMPFGLQSLVGPANHY